MTFAAILALGAAKVAGLLVLGRRRKGGDSGPLAGGPAGSEPDLDRDSGGGPDAVDGGDSGGGD